MQLRSATVAGLLLLACVDRPAPTSAHSANRPRTQVLVLVTASDGGSIGLEEPWRAEDRRCAGDRCGTLRLLAIDGPAAGFAAALQQRSDPSDGGTPRLSVNWLGAIDAVMANRAGVELRLLGLSAGAGRFEESLQRVQMPYFMQGPKGTVLISDVCVDELKDLVRRDGVSWPFLLLAIGRECGRGARAERVYSTLVVSAPEARGDYTRVTLTFDQSTAALLKADERFLTSSARE